MSGLVVWLVPLVAGLLFGIGLMLSGMVEPGKVQAFLAGLTKILDKVALNLPADKARKP